MFVNVRLFISFIELHFPGCCHPCLYIYLSIQLFGLKGKSYYYTLSIFIVFSPGSILILEVDQKQVYMLILGYAKDRAYTLRDFE